MTYMLNFVLIYTLMYLYLNMVHIVFLVLGVTVFYFYYILIDWMQEKTLLFCIYAYTQTQTFYPAP